MTTVTSTTLINQSVERVFYYVTSAESHKEWQDGILEVTLLPDGPIGIGSLYQYTSKLRGRPIITQVQVNHYERNLAWGIITLPTPVETLYIFEPADDGTSLTITRELSGDYSPDDEALIIQQVQHALDEQGNRIKELVER